MYFSKAKKIFLSEHRFDQHVFAGFHTVIRYDGQTETHIQITASAFYKLYVNGEFISYGPARAAHEYARVDNLDIKKYLHLGENHIAAEVIGYYGRISLAGTGEPAFIIAQIDADGDAVSYTGDGKWDCYLLRHKDLNAIPFSHARFWQENYSVCPDTHVWRTGKTILQPVECETIDDKVTFIPRTASFPDFDVAELSGACYTSGIKNAVMTDIIDVTESDPVSYIDFDFGEFRSGFIGIEFECGASCEVILMYQEKISREEGEFTFEFSGQTAYSRANTSIRFSPGISEIETFEAYAVRYLRIMVKGAESYRIRRLYVRLCQIKNLFGGGFQCSDGEINRIFKANRTSLIINTFDTFMDCAQRERGSGWNDACYWIAPAAQMMLGDVSVEKCYLENQIADTVQKHCDLPYACYPATYRCVIHNWTIYLLLELSDYYRRSGDKVLLTSHEKGIRFLVDSLNKYKNSSGLLENLDEIVYTSSYTTSYKEEQNAVYNQPVSTTTNFMFADAIKKLGEILEINEWVRQAELIENIIRRVPEQVKDDEEAGGFLPSSIRMDKSGTPVSTGYESEGAQYFWIVYGFFNRENLPLKLNRIFDHMGPAPAEKYSHDLYWMKRMGYEGDFFARLQALSMYGKTEQIIREIKSYGLWAMDRFAGLFGEGWDWFSCNHHSFNAFFNYILEREILGCDLADEINKVIKISPHTAGLKWAKGHITTKNGICSIHWINNEKEFRFKADIPKGYTVHFTVPVSVTSRNRIFTLNNTVCDIPAEGILILNSDFEFVSIIG